MKRGQAGAALPKVLLLIVFIGLLVSYYLFVNWNGVIGNVSPLPTSTVGDIVFVRRDGNGSNIYLVKADGTGEQKLTNDNTMKHAPAWSPDGKRICYSGEVHDENGTSDQLFMLGSGDAKRMTRGTGSTEDPQWRPDGSKIAFLAGGVIKIVDPNGSSTEQIYPPVHKGGSQGSGDSGAPDSDLDSALKLPPITRFKWSPNGQSIAGVQVMEGEETPTAGQPKWWDKPAGQDDASQAPSVLEPETLVLLPNLDSKPKMMWQTNAKQVGFDWMPDGQKIAVAITTRGKEHGIGVFRADEADLTSARPIGLFTSVGYGATAHEPVVSPDGSRIAFEAVRVGSAEDSTLMGIGVIGTDPGHAVVIQSVADVSKLPLVIPGNATKPRWSPDGKRLLYQVEDSKGSNIWVANADGTNRVQITHSGSNFDASWSPAR